MKKMIAQIKKFIFMKRKFKHKIVKNSTNINKRNNHLDSMKKSLKKKKNATYSIGNPVPDFRQTQKCGEVILVNVYYDWSTQFINNCLMPYHGENMIHFNYVIKFISDLRQVSGFLRVLWFPPPIKLTVTI